PHLASRQTSPYDKWKMVDLPDSPEQGAHAFSSPEPETPDNEEEFHDHALMSTSESELAEQPQQQHRSGYRRGLACSIIWDRLHLTSLRPTLSQNQHSMTDDEARDFIRQHLDFQRQSFMDLDPEMSLQERVHKYLTWMRRATDFAVLRQHLPYHYYGSLVAHALYIGNVELTTIHRHAQRDNRARIRAQREHAEREEQEARRRQENELRNQTTIPQFFSRLRRRSRPSTDKAAGSRTGQNTAGNSDQAETRRNHPRLQAPINPLTGRPASTWEENGVIYTQRDLHGNSTTPRNANYVSQRPARVQSGSVALAQQTASSSNISAAPRPRPRFSRGMCPLDMTGPGEFGADSSDASPSPEPVKHRISYSEYLNLKGKGPGR
ncbi:hypothetical protein OC834_007156, partial [Tilletia horrida]